MSSQDVFAKMVDEGPVKQDKLLQDDEILTAEERKRPENAAAECGAESNKPKKPCANCTCGLAEKETNGQDAKTTSDSEAPKASCGSCYLGDAFRCASCPYRGMPAFKPGEKVTIDTTSDDL